MGRLLEEQEGGRHPPSAAAQSFRHPSTHLEHYTMAPNEAFPGLVPGPRTEHLPVAFWQGSWFPGVLYRNSV